MNLHNLLNIIYKGNLKKYDYTSKVKPSLGEAEYSSEYAKLQVNKFKKIIRVSQAIKIIALGAALAILISVGVLHV